MSDVISHADSVDSLHFPQKLEMYAQEALENLQLPDENNMNVNQWNYVNHYQGDDVLVVK